MTSSTLGLLLLGIWLILAGAMPLTGVSFPHSATVMELLMIVSGVLLVMGARGAGKRWLS